MGLGKFVKKTINIAGTVAKFSVEIGTEAVGSITEKLNHNTQSKDKIIDYGRCTGQNIRKNTDQFADSSVDIVDAVVDSTIKTCKNISEDLLVKVSEFTKKK